MTQGHSLGDAKARHQRLYELLRSATPAESECAAYLPRFDEYIAAQLNGEDYLSRYPEIAIHLDRCVTCADSYARLYELEVALAAEALPAPQDLPVPDLSFLAAPRAKAAPSLVDLLADALIITAKNFQLQLTAELLALLQPNQPIALTRASVDDSRYHEVLYELQAEQLLESTMPLRLTVYRDSLHPENALLEVVVMPPEVSWPNLGGYTVTLRMSQDSMTATTDAWGVVAFVDIPVARLTEVTLLVDLA